MRPDRRRGRRGKSARILDLIDHYWPQIEGDFAKFLHVDARDFIRGGRPWDQFLNYCDTVAQEDGGRLWAAQLADDRYDAEIERMLAERKTTRPGLEGDTAVVRAIRELRNDIRLLIKHQLRVNLSTIKGPEGPADRIAARKTAMTRARIQQLLDDE